MKGRKSSSEGREKEEMKRGDRAPMKRPAGSGEMKEREG